MADNYKGCRGTFCLTLYLCLRRVTHEHVSAHVCTHWHASKERAKCNINRSSLKLPGFFGGVGKLKIDIVPHRIWSAESTSRLSLICMYYLVFTKILSIYDKGAFYCHVLSGCFAAQWGSSCNFSAGRTRKLREGLANVLRDGPLKEKKSFKRPSFCLSPCFSPEM